MPQNRCQRTFAEASVAADCHVLCILISRSVAVAGVLTSSITLLVLLLLKHRLRWLHDWRERRQSRQRRHIRRQELELCL